MTRTYTIKRKSDNWEYFDDFTASCWYEAQKIFTGKMRKLVVGKYVRFEDKQDAENFGIDYKGPGLYPKLTGHILTDKNILSSFFDGEYAYTINKLSEAQFNHNVNNMVRCCT